MALLFGAVVIIDTHPRVLYGWRQRIGIRIGLIGFNYHRGYIWRWMRVCLGKLRDLERGFKANEAGHDAKEKFVLQ
jgi:hypothetical protein